jgi:hypothetical protein
MRPEAWVERLQAGQPLALAPDEARELGQLLDLAIHWKPGPKRRITPEMEATIRAHISRGTGVKQACHLAGIGDRAWQRHLERQRRGAP